MKVGNLEQFRNDLACKDKWCNIASDFKKIYNFIACIRNNQDYWTMGI